MPLSVWVPVPTLVTPPVPPMFPAKAVVALVPPVVRVPLPSATLEPDTPASEPIVWLLSPRSSVAPVAARFTAVAVGKYCLPLIG